MANIVGMLILMISAVSMADKNNSQQYSVSESQQVIEHLNLKPLPEEGGYYKETYRSSDKIQFRFSNDDPEVTRSVSTAIYYMVLPDSFSALHRITQDEVFHHYLGEPVDMLLIHPNGSHQLLKLGKNISEGEQPQIVVPAGTWQGLKLSSKSNGYALLGTTVAPGFEFADFELAIGDDLVNQYPDLESLIRDYTRPSIQN